MNVMWHVAFHGGVVDGSVPSTWLSSTAERTAVVQMGLGILSIFALTYRFMAVWGQIPMTARDKFRNGKGLGCQTCDALELGEIGLKGMGRDYCSTWEGLHDDLEGSGGITS